MKIGFTGTQKGLTSSQLYTLVVILNKLNPNETHHGDCIGGDMQFHMLQGFKSFITIHPPENPIKRAYCKGNLILKPKGYLERNKDIVKASDLLIACPGQKKEITRSGTWATIRYARKINKPHVIILP